MNWMRPSITGKYGRGSGLSSSSPRRTRGEHTATAAVRRSSELSLQEFKSAELYCETETGTVRLYCEPVAMTDDVTSVTIRHGQIITRVWYFEARREDGSPVPPGTYCLNLTYLDNFVIKENFLEIKARSAQQNAGGDGRKLSALSFLKPKAGGIH